MEVGVLDMFPGERGSWYIIRALFELGYNPVVLNMDTVVAKKQSLAKLIGRSGIKHWIFSGSPQRVHNASSVQIPLNCLAFKDKEFLLICYSMESVLNQLKFEVRERFENKKEYFNLHIQQTKAYIYGKSYLFKGISNPMYCWRNHRWYTPALRDEPLVELASYRGELMMAFYKNLLFTQFHPERSYDGKKFMRNWLFGK